MQINRIGIRTSIFCITFLGAFLAVEYSVSNNTEKIILKPTVKSNQMLIELSLSEPPCRKTFDFSKYNDLQKDEVSFTKQLINEIESSQDQKKTRQKLKNLQSEIKSLEKFRGKLMKNEREQRGIHNLLYMENCAEYNESY